MALPPHRPRKAHPTSERAAILHQGRVRPPAPTLASTRAAWLRPNPNSRVSAQQLTAWRHEEAAWKQGLASTAPSERAAVMRLSKDQFAAGTMPGTPRYYIVLFGRWNGMRLEVDTAYLLADARQFIASLPARYEASHQVADMVAWCKASKVVAEMSLKIDAGIQGRLEGMLWGVKAKADLNVVKVDLIDIKADFTKPDKFTYTRAGTNGVTKVSNGLTVSADIPWLPKTPYGAVSLGGVYEQSQLIDGDLQSSSFKQDYGMYVGIPVYQSPGMKQVGERLKLNPATTMAKGPDLKAKLGKPKDFYGMEIAGGAAVLMGFEVKVKGGLTK